MLYAEPPPPFSPNHNLAFSLPPSLHFRTKLHAKSPNGPICSPISFAFALLATRIAYRAAIPCIITLFLNTPNASPHAFSAAGSQPAASAYQAMHSAREGRPGVEAVGRKAGLVREARVALEVGEEAAGEGLRAKV